jgi:hypothetical protein
VWVVIEMEGEFGFSLFLGGGGFFMVVVVVVVVGI